MLPRNPLAPPDEVLPGTSMPPLLSLIRSIRAERCWSIFVKMPMTEDIPPPFPEDAAMLPCTTLPNVLLVRDTLSLFGSILEPLGRFTSSGPSSPTQVSPPRQLLSPAAFFPTLPDPLPPEPAILAPVLLIQSATLPIAEPIPSTIGCTTLQTLSRIL